MSIVTHQSKSILLTLLLIFLCNPAFAQTFDVNSSEDLLNALKKANQTPNDLSSIIINNDVSLQSAINEIANIEILGNNHNLSLGNKFTLSGVDKNADVSNLNLQLPVSGGGIEINRQLVNLTNSNFIGNSINDGNSILFHRSGTLGITGSTFSNNLGDRGGAISNFGALNLSSSTIQNNNAQRGGGIFSGTALVNVIDSTIQNNHATYRGGGIFLSSGTLSVNNSIINGNKANSQGGAIYMEGGSLNAIGTTISNNFSELGGAALYADKKTTATFSNSTFENNYISKGSVGGAIYNDGTLMINNSSSFINNRSEVGAAGAIANNGTANISNTTFNNNYALNEGGAISSVGNLTIANSNFINNKAENTQGGAISAAAADVTIANTSFRNNSSGFYGGAIALLDATSNVSNCDFSNNYSDYAGGAVVVSSGGAEFNDNNIFVNNSTKYDGGAIFIAPETEGAINGGAQFWGNNAEQGRGGALYVAGTLDINANDIDKTVIFSGNSDKSGKNAFHIDGDEYEQTGVGIVNLNVSNGSIIRIEDNISGTGNSQLNLSGTSSVSDHIYFGSANNNFNGDISANNINLHFYNLTSGMPNGLMTATNTHFDLINGAIGQTPLNLNLLGGGNELSIDVDPANLTADYIQMNGDPSVMSTLAIRDINLLSNPVQSVTIFDLYDHETYGTDLALSDKIKNATVYDATKAYRWSLTPKLTLMEIIGKCNPNIQRYQAATAAAYMNQVLSFDYSLNRTDEIYMNLREQKLAARLRNSYAFNGPAGTYVDYYDEDGSAFWMRPYVNLERFHLTGLEAAVMNQSYGVMLGFDFPMVVKYDWKLFSTIYGSYIGSSQQYLESNMNQNGGYGGYLLSAYKDNFYAGWTINGGGVGVHSAYLNGSDNYGIVTAGTALKLAYNLKLKERLIIQPNFTTSYLYLSPANLVNFQAVDMNQTQVNGLLIAPSMRITYRNETGIEPYVFGGCVIPIMSDVKATANNNRLENLSLNAWAQFGAGLRKRINERVTCFVESVIRTGGRDGWGLMFNIEIKV